MLPGKLLLHSPDLCLHDCRKIGLVFRLLVLISRFCMRIRIDMRRPPKVVTWQAAFAFSGPLPTRLSQNRVGVSTFGSDRPILYGDFNRHAQATRVRRLLSGFPLSFLMRLLSKFLSTFLTRLLSEFLLTFSTRLLSEFLLTFLARLLSDFLLTLFNVLTKQISSNLFVCLLSKFLSFFLDALKGRAPF